MENTSAYRTRYSTFKNWSLILGILMVLLGLMTIAISPVTTLFSIAFLGIVLTIRGGFDIVHTLTIRYQKESNWNLFNGILSVVIGVLILSRPAITVGIITFLISVYLISSGLFRTIASPVERQSQWGVTMLGGIVSLLLGIWVIAGWPEISFWLIGIFVGVEILVQGMVLIAMPYSMKQAGGPSGQAFSH